MGFDMRETILDVSWTNCILCRRFDGRMDCRTFGRSYRKASGSSDMPLHTGYDGCGVVRRSGKPFHKKITNFKRQKNNKENSNLLIIIIDVFYLKWNVNFRIIRPSWFFVDCKGCLFKVCKIRHTFFRWNCCLQRLGHSSR